MRADLRDHVEAVYRCGCGHEWKCWWDREFGSSCGFGDACPECQDDQAHHCGREYEVHRPYKGWLTDEDGGNPSPLRITPGATL